jgi:hypothetical protein
MNSQKTTADFSTRAGEQHRANTDRYFHVMSQGWYAYTREGIRGPFFDKNRAEGFIIELLDQRNADPSSSWRL